MDRLAEIEPNYRQQTHLVDMNVSPWICYYPNFARIPACMKSITDFSRKRVLSYVAIPVVAPVTVSV